MNANSSSNCSIADSQLVRDDNCYPFKESNPDNGVFASTDKKLSETYCDKKYRTEEVTTKNCFTKSPKVKRRKGSKFQLTRNKQYFKRRRKLDKSALQTNRFTRRLWNEEEDLAITALVQRYGFKKWTLISRKLREEYSIYDRSGKQCRERYVFSNLW